ncbi:FtsX-like permease family protein [Treponema parvum]|uniref:FtsX-like permease family protein n=1 Tax=Treponema parvum TaxID=138851 RepID=UPI001AEC5743|nr:FtsX-like permease family protein [Treponema parvum]QTQ16033.1 ABC transporter permease [Treponema parvum]
MFALKLGLRSLFFRKKQYVSLFIVCCLGVGISLFSIYVMNGMLKALSMKARIYYGGDLQFIGGNGNLYFDDYRPIIEKLSAVFPENAIIAPRFDFEASYAALYFEGTGVRQRVIKGVDFTKEKKLFTYFNYVSGSAEDMAGTNGILLSKPIADMLGADTGDSITLMLKTQNWYTNTVTLVVKGIFRDSSLFGMYTSYMDFDVLRSAFGLPESAANRIGVFFPDKEPSGRDIARYQAELEKKFPMYPLVNDKYVFYDDLLAARLPFPTYALIAISANLKDLGGLIDAMRAIAVFIIVSLVLIIVAGVSSSYRVLVMKRCNEIGIYMAIGMKRRGISFVLLSEASVLLLSGCLAGFLLSIVLSLGLRVWNLSFIPAFDIFLTDGAIVPSIDMFSVFKVIFFVIVTTALAVLFATRKAVSMTPVQALAVTE